MHHPINNSITDLSSVVHPVPPPPPLPVSLLLLPPSHWGEEEEEGGSEIRASLAPVLRYTHVRYLLREWWSLLQIVRDFLVLGGGGDFHRVLAKWGAALLYSCMFSLMCLKYV